MLQSLDHPVPASVTGDGVHDPMNNRTKGTNKRASVHERTNERPCTNEPMNERAGTKARARRIWTNERTNERA